MFEARTTTPVQLRNLTLVAWAVLAVEAAVLMWLRQPWLASDSLHYLELAANLSDLGFVSPAREGIAPEAMRSPGYPLLLNALIYQLGTPIAVVVGLQLVLYLISLALIAYGLIRSERLRFVFLCIAVFYIFPLAYSTYLLSEGVAIFLVAALAAVLAVKWRHSLFQAALAGTIAGVATLFRGDLLPTIAAVVLVLLWQYRLRLASALAHSVLAILAAVLVITPYAIWNHATFGRFSPVPVGSTIGQSLYLATWESTLSLADRQAIVGGPTTKAAIEAGLADDLSKIQAEGARQAASLKVAEKYPARQQEIATVKAHLRPAFERIERDPMDMVLHVLNATWRLLNTSEFPGVPAPLAAALKVISFSVFFAGVAGAWLACSRGIASSSPLLVWLSVQLPHLPLHTEARYTASIRLIMMFYAAVAVTMLVERMVREPGRRSTQNKGIPSA